MPALMRRRLKIRILFGLAVLLGVWFYFSLPENLFPAEYSTVVLDRDGELLGASIATDGQWRFPMGESPSEKFEKALLYYEDEYFYYHPGVNPISTLRALWQNIQRGEVVSGGSTITMQVIRLSRQRGRTFLEKIFEMILATRLELRHSKNEILDLYSANAPFGGNVVGLDAAAWRYYGRSPSELSWSEAATLAVLPNSPGLIHPGRNRNALKLKRDFLLDKLLENGEIDSLTNRLAKTEEIPQKPKELPARSVHLLNRMRVENPGSITKSTIDLRLQEHLYEVLDRAYSKLSPNEIHNAAAIIARVNTGEVLAYIGNVASGIDHGQDVDIIKAPRSTGSLLKPFLYTAMIQEGLMMPGELVPDIPLYIDGFNPNNFDGSFDGAVPANEALYRSLNVPAVQILRQYRYEKFHSLLNDLGMSTLDTDAGRYGLSLILGGAEGTLWDMSQMYLQMGFRLANGKNSPLPVLHTEKGNPKTMEGPYPFDPAAIWHTFDALKQVIRPDEEGRWQSFSSSSTVAWKTGTSFGHRDAWAIGVTPQYVVGVWTGNADGEGRPGLTGIKTAAPIMFDILSGLEYENWFLKPTQGWKSMEICSRSGKRASDLCPETHFSQVFNSLFIQTGCDYHRKIHLDAGGNFRVTAECYPVSRMLDTTWFALPPVQEYFYSLRNGSYSILPPLKTGCRGDQFAPMQFIYPNAGSSVYIPYQLDGSKSKLLLEIAHRDKKEVVYWHIDHEYQGMTRGNHQLAIDPEPGLHTITLVDGNGEKLSRRITFLKRYKGDY